MSRSNRYTKEARLALVYARTEARRLQHKIVGTEHLLLGILKLGDPLIESLFASFHVNTLYVVHAVEFVVGRGNRAYTSGPTMGPEVRAVLVNAERETAADHEEQIGIEHLLLGLFGEPGSVMAGVLESFGVKYNALRQQCDLLLKDGRTRILLRSRYAAGYEETPVLNQVSRDLTLAALAGELDPVIGREIELERTMQILARRSKNNPVLLGHAGVGKTAIVEALALRIIQERVAQDLQNCRVVALDMGLLPVNTRFRGDFEEQLKRIIQEIVSARSIILFIDEVHTLAQTGGAEGSIDAANLFKPLLARGEIRCIGATTSEEYRRWIEADPALERRFQPVYIPEATAVETLEMLRGLRARYAEFHKVTISDEALLAAVQLSSRYIQNRSQPDKAIDLLDEAAARLVVQSSSMPEGVRKLRDEVTAVRKSKECAIDRRDFVTASRQRNKEICLRQQLSELEQQWLTAQGRHCPLVGEQEIAQVVAEKTGLPLLALATEEAERLLNLEETLHRRVIGQHAAVQAVARALRRSRANVRDTHRPIGSFIFVGPTGVGKTMLARILAATLFGDESALIKLDMSEFMEMHHIARLVGAPPGYAGYEQAGQLTEAVYRRPYSVILFDEVEKAHPRVFDLLLQILDDGCLTDAHGKRVDFTSTLIILASNIGTSLLGRRALAFTSTAQERQAEASEQVYYRALPLLKEVFKPELLNRIDEIVPFHNLEPAHVRAIVDLLIGETQQRMQEQAITLQVSDEARSLLARHGYDPAYGARALRRTVQSLLDDMLAESLLQAAYSPGDTIVVSVADGHLLAKPEATKSSKERPAA